jgi:hypothetical protein
VPNLKLPKLFRSASRSFTSHVAKEVSQRISQIAT